MSKLAALDAKDSDKDDLSNVGIEPEPEEEVSKEDENVTFESLGNISCSINTNPSGLIPQLIEACNLMGFKRPTKIQRDAIPYAIKGNHLIQSPLIAKVVTLSVWLKLVLEKLPLLHFLFFKH